MTDGLEYLGRARMQGVILLIVVFLAGALAGAAGDRLWSVGGPRAPRGPGFDRGPGPGFERGPGFGHGPGGPDGPHGLPGPLERLDLSERQRHAIDSLLDLQRPRSQAIMRRVLPQLRAEADSLRAGIRAVLNVEQRQAFDRDMPPPPRDSLDMPPPFGGPPGFGPRGPRRGRPGFPPPGFGPGGPSPEGPPPQGGPH